jgi:hypothetical protein
MGNEFSTDRIGCLVVGRVEVLAGNLCRDFLELTFFCRLQEPCATSVIPRLDFKGKQRLLECFNIGIADRSVSARFMMARRIVTTTATCSSGRRSEKAHRQ